MPSGAFDPAAPPAAPPATAPPAGTGEVLGPYELLEELGRGGQGVVFRARDRRLHRLVAVKLLDPRLLDPREGAAALLAEARLAARVRHPHVAALHGLEEHAGRALLVMELVDGPTLEAIAAGGPLPLEQALAIAAGVASGLAAAHAAGVVHGDLSCANVRLEADGSPKLLDFGLGRRREDPPGEDGRRGPAGGTLAYLAPERLRGAPPAPEADIFALGVLIYRMLAGRLPYASPADTGAAPRPLWFVREDVPPALEGLLARLLSADAAVRPRAAEVATTLAELAAGHAATGARGAPRAGDAGDTPQPRASSAPDARHARRAAAGAVALAAAAVAALVTGRPWPGVLAGLAAAACLAAWRWRRHRRLPPRGVPATAAFRGLLPFAERDRDRFRGREVEVAALAALVEQPDFRFGVLYGESGSGKTSLLRAGLVPRLWERGLAPLYCRLHAGQIEALHEAIRRQTGLAVDPGLPAADALRCVAAELGTRVVVVLDQFEDLFAGQADPESHAEVVRLVGEAVRDAALPVGFLLAVREDRLFLVADAFDRWVSEPLASARRFRLSAFTPARALEVVAACLAELPQADPALAPALVADLTRDGRVLPAELQIIGDQLQRRGLATLAAYRKAGGKDALVHGYLDDVVAAAPDPPTMRLALRSLVSDDMTRAARTLDEIAALAERPPARVGECLALLVRARVVRVGEDGPSPRYELLHDRLLGPVNRLTARVLDARSRADRLARQYLSQAQADRHAAVPLRHILFIRRHSRLRHDGELRRLIRRSLGRGLLRATAWGLATLGSVLAAAAYLSLREEWDERLLNGGHTAAARRLALLPDCRTLLSAGEDGRILAWDLPSRELAAVVAHEPEVWTALAADPGGRYLAAGSRRGLVRVWATGDFRRVADLPLPGGEIGWLGFTPDGRHLAATRPGATTFWATADWRLAGRSERGSDTNFGAFFTGGGSRLLLCEWGEIAVPGGELAGSGPRPGNYAAISERHDLAVDLTTEGWTVFSRMGDGRLLGRFPTFRDHPRGVRFSPDGRTVAVLSDSVVLFAAATRERIERLRYASIVWDAVFSAGGTHLVSAHGDGSVLVWNLSTRDLEARLNGHSGFVRAVAFSPDGSALASGGEDGAILVWDVRSGGKRAVLPYPSRVNALAFAGPDELVACGQFAPVVRYRVSARRELARHGCRGGADCIACYALAAARGGQLVATSNGIYDRGGSEVVPFGGPGAAACATVYGVAFSPDERLLACGDESGRVILRDTDDRRQFPAGEAAVPSRTCVEAVAFSPAGRELATADDRGEIWLWSLDPLRPRRRLGAHAARAKAAAFLPGGNRLVTAGDDGLVALWEVPRGRLAARIGSNTAPVLAIAVSPSGTHLASAGFDGTVRLYRRRLTLWGMTLGDKE